MVIIGYGKYRNHRIQEIPDSFLSELAERYRLSHEAQKDADSTELLLTIAVHEEVKRRRDGGPILPREPTAREMAIKLVSKGYEILSKDHHPDRTGGSNTAQTTLNEVRAALLRACEDIKENFEGALIVPEPRTAASFGGITDEDIPF